MADLAIISLHDKGFWQGDLYRDASDMTASDMEMIGPAPDDFFTLATDDPLDKAMHTAIAEMAGSANPGCRL